MYRTNTIADFIIAPKTKPTKGKSAKPTVPVKPAVVKPTVPTDNVLSLDNLFKTIGDKASLGQAETRVTIPASVTFSPINCIALPLVNDGWAAKIVVDGWNFLHYINETVNVEDIATRIVPSRQIRPAMFADDNEYVRAFEVAVAFFNYVIPAQSQIYFVFKKVGTDARWNSFVTLFRSYFFNPDVRFNHIYHFYVANEEFPGDTECDDRLVARLALSYRCYILSNDCYYSMNNNWHCNSSYNCIDAKGTEFPGTLNANIFDRYNCNNRSQIKFSFWFEPDGYDGIRKMRMAYF